jgi:tRNA U34 2-thiouridine synthase MnmA/TrmU
MAKLGVRLVVRDAAAAMMRFVPEPRFGWGKHLNPCLDCRVHHLSVAKSLMGEFGASFVFTGEVVGQRPMSQYRDALARVEREAGLERMVLRPLTALNLDVTEPEERGWVDRGKLLGIQGRSRAEQNALVTRWNLSGFTTPAGGCLLTDPQFSWKLEDLLNYETLTPNDAHLLKYGRHFRLDERTRVVVGRDQRDNARVVTLRRPGDWILVATSGSSPEVLLRGDASERTMEIAARLTARYSAARDDPAVTVEARSASSTFAGERAEVKRLTVAPADEGLVARLAVRRPEKTR